MTKSHNLRNQVVAPSGRKCELHQMVMEDSRCPVFSGGAGDRRGLKTWPPGPLISITTDQIEQISANKGKTVLYMQYCVCDVLNHFYYKMYSKD